jgi:RNA polymerase sigma factor (sigma-70 family)
LDTQRLARFEHLWETLFPRVLGYALRRSDAEEARDVTSETFLVAWRRLDDVPRDDGALPWLLATARGILANRRRSAGHGIRVGQLLAETRPVTSPDPAEAVAERAALAAAFARLDERDRDTLAMIAWDGLAPREAALVAGCSPATFAVRAHRARRRLAASIAVEDATALEIRRELS